MSKARLELNGKTYEFPVITGSEGEVGIDVKALRAQSKAITLDPGYGNTGSCQSAITFINGEEGVLRYRGYSIEELAEKLSFEEVMYLLIWEELPNEAELTTFKGKLEEYSKVDGGIKRVLEGFPRDAHPMVVLQALLPALGVFAPGESDDEDDILRLIGGLKALAAWSYRHSRDLPYVETASGLSYAGDFVHMMFGEPGAQPNVSPQVETAMNKLLILHADHEQNCSTSTVRMVGSAAASLYASISAGVGALSGPLHGGANQ
ncbi:MAG: citrate/2-methylcitrate synthase, partial [Bradymonadaceae bacterium]